MAETFAGPAPTLMYLVGPPAAGKMTVGQEIAARTGIRLFHNHMTIELVLQFFEFGSPPFGRLVEEFRQRLMAEVAGSDLPGVIFTFVWAFDLPSELALERYAHPFRQRGGRVLFVELQADQAERLLRNESATRLAKKPPSATWRRPAETSYSWMTNTASAPTESSTIAPTTYGSTTPT